MKGRNLIITGALLFGTTAGSFAQTADTGFVSLSPQFFFSVIAGVILAFGFQLLLSTLATATGISLIGNIKDKFTGKNDHNRNANKNANKDKDEDKTPLGVKVTTAGGIASVVLTAVSLFFASWLAVRFSLVLNPVIGMILGLVIWSLTMMFVAYVDYKAAKSLVGGLWSIVREGFSVTVDSAKAMFGKSDEAKIEAVAGKTVNMIKAEVNDMLDHSQLLNHFDDYIQQLSPREMDYERIKSDLVNMLKDVELRQETEYGDDGMILKKTFIDVAASSPKVSKEHVKKLGSVFDEAKSIAQSDGSNADKLTKAFDKFTPGSEEDSSEFREKVVAYLKSTGKNEFTPERLKKDIETIMRDPVSSKDIAKRKVRSLDKAAIVSALSERTDMDEGEADKIVSQVQNVFSSFTEKVKGKTEEAEESADSMANQVSQKAKSAKGEASNKTSGFEEKIRNYFNSMEREELNYDRMKMDFQKIMKDPNVALPILKERLHKMDRHSMSALISANSTLSRDEAELIFDKFDEAKRDAIEFAEKVEDTAKEKVEEAKMMALQQAENVRKTAASAAWWLAATFVISGVAAAIGGMVAF